MTRSHTQPPVFRIALVEWGHHQTTLVVAEEGIAAKIEFRGDGIWQWGLGVPSMSETAYRARKTWLRSHGTRICWAEWLHDGLEGWHCCVLYTGDWVAILPPHPDYAHVSHLVRMSQLSEREVIQLMKEAS